MLSMRRSTRNIPRFHFCLFICALLFFIPQLQSVLNLGDAKAVIFWLNKDGTANGFDWRNGGSDNGRFGNPILVGGNTFVFFPPDFRADSVNGVGETVADRVQFEIIAHSGKEIQGIRITEYGDYAILNQGSVSATGSLFLTNLNPFEVHYDELDTTPISPINGGQGTWTGQVVVNDIHWTHLQVVLDNNLMAFSLPGSTSFIQKKIVGGGVDIEIIVPEPATVALLMLGSLSFIPLKKH